MESMVILSHTLGCVSYASQLSSITVGHSRAQRIHIRCKPNSWLVSFFGRHIAASKLGITMTPRSPLRGGGGADLSWSELQNPSFLVLRRKPCPYRYFTIIFVLNFVTVRVSTHLLSFVVISAVFVAVWRPNYLSEFYPSRTSVTYHVPQHSLSSVVAHMQQTAWLSSWIFETSCTNKRRHMTHCFSLFSKWRACMQANCRSSFACWFGSPASLSRQYSLIWWMLKRRQ